VPLLDALPEATSLDTIPVLPILLGSEDVWQHNAQEWTKE
jgi:hypothetical protein